MKKQYWQLKKIVSGDGIYEFKIYVSAEFINDSIKCCRTIGREKVIEYFRSLCEPNDSHDIVWIEQNELIQINHPKSNGRGIWFELEALEGGDSKGTFGYSHNCENTNQIFDLLNLWIQWVNFVKYFILNFKDQSS